MASAAEQQKSSVDRWRAALGTRGIARLMSHEPGSPTPYSEEEEEEVDVADYYIHDDIQKTATIRSAADEQSRKRARVEASRDVSASAASAAAAGSSAQDTAIDADALTEDDKAQIQKACEGSTYIFLTCGDWSVQLRRCAELFEASPVLRAAFQDAGKSTHQLNGIPAITHAEFISFSVLLDFPLCDRSQRVPVHTSANLIASWILLADSLAIEHIGRALTKELEERVDELSAEDCYEMGRRWCNKTLLFEAAMRWMDHADLTASQKQTLGPFWQLAFKSVFLSTKYTVTQNEWHMLFYFWRVRNQAHVAGPITTAPRDESSRVLYQQFKERSHRIMFAKWMAVTGYQKVKMLMDTGSAVHAFNEYLSVHRFD